MRKSPTGMVWHPKLLITESGYLLKFPECLNFSVETQSQVENGISAGTGTRRLAPAGRSMYIS
jgi:hypothetical protein